jgi:formylglycine-generating enzyme required for sulfatase activity
LLISVMKKLLILLFSLLSLTVFAQQKKVAVYVVGNDPINFVMGNHLVDKIAHNGKYIAVERTASFLREILNEQSYQQSGSVDDSEIASLGEQFGVDYVCVATPYNLWGEKYISTRMIDVERAEVIATSSAHGEVNNNPQLLSLLNTLSEGLIRAFEQSKMTDAKKVAVYVTRTGNADIDIILGDQLVAGFAQSGRYLAIERTQDFLDQITKEKGYQDQGPVEDEELMRIGKQLGVQYVCVANTSMLFGDYYIVTRLLDVEHNMVVNSYNKQAIQLNSSQQVVSVAQEIASKLSDKTIAEQQHGDGSSTQDFTETAYGVNMKMIWVEGGEFLMGCTSEQGNDCADDEENVRRVTVDGFYIGMLEVTQAQWEKVMGTSVYQQRNKANPDWSIYGIGDDYPMYYVSWEEAMEFCRQLSAKTGRNYTLPTEAQWEYAARGGSKNDRTKYAGSNYISDVAWYNGNSYSSTHKVGSKRANALGIYDMSGNVWELCKDRGISPYSSYDTNNPTGPSSGVWRIRRGGCWCHEASICRVANRGGTHDDLRSNEDGFRVVLLP